MNLCIFVFRFKLNEKEQRVIQVLSEFHKQFRIKKISSVFKKSNRLSSRLDEELAFAISTQTDVSLENLLSVKNTLTGFDYKVDLVAFNDEIQWTPDLTLPSPVLNFDSLALHCCAEIEPNYIHPIMKEELKKMDINNTKPDFEFLFQGKIYIDHLQ